MLEHCPICKSDDRARLGLKKRWNGWEKKERDEDDRWLRSRGGWEVSSTRDVQSWGSFCSDFLLRAERFKESVYFQRRELRRLLAEIEYFQRHFPLPLCCAAAREKKRRSEVSLLSRVTEVSSRLFSSLVSACRTIFSSCTMHGVRYLNAFLWRNNFFFFVFSMFWSVIS